MQLRLRDITNSGIPLLNIRYSHRGQSSDQAFYDAFTDFAGNTNWPLAGNTPPLHKLSFWVNMANVNPDYVRWEVYPETCLETDPNDPTEQNIVIHLPFEELTRLHVEGHDFYNERHERVFLKGATDFLLYKKYLDGENIDDLLAQRRSFGANCVRVIGMVSSFAHWFPQEYGDRYFDELPNFCRKVAGYGMYVYYTVFADANIVFSGSDAQKQAAQLGFWNRITGVLRTIPNVIGEFRNEPYAHENDVVDYKQFPDPGFLCSGGSFDDRLGNNLRPVPTWEYFHDFHSPRDAKDDELSGGFKSFGDQNATPHPEYRKRGKAILSGEPQKFADPTDPRRGGSTLSNPTLARKMAGSARGTMAGIVYHTPSGVFSTLWNGKERQCAAEWFAELR